MIGIQPGSMRSALHVVFQIAFVILIYVTGISYPRGTLLLILYALFFVPALWAMYIMKFKFNISPELFRGVKLATGGPYSLIRHPMYTSLLGITLCLIVDDFSITRTVYWLLLAVNMLLKLLYEEQILSRKLPEYTDYMKKTKRLIPFIF